VVDVDQIAPTVYRAGVSSDERVEILGHLTPSAAHSLGLSVNEVRRWNGEGPAPTLAVLPAVRGG
jgi:hypothetical protein